jgi:hypothetical protein
LNEKSPLYGHDASLLRGIVIARSASDEAIQAPVYQIAASLRLLAMTARLN